MNTFPTLLWDGNLNMAQEKKQNTCSFPDPLPTLLCEAQCVPATLKVAQCSPPMLQSDLFLEISMSAAQGSP